MSPLAPECDRVWQALRAASDVLRRHAATDVPFSLKDGCSPVTAADHEVDDLLRHLLPSPGDGWLSEETDDGPARLSCRRVWVCDPIDGTRAFVAKRPEYSVSIGLLLDGTPVLGGITNPATGVTVVGGPGIPLVVEGEPVLPWTAGDDRPRVLASRSEWRRGEWHAVARDCQVLPVGSVAYKLALVAAGAADATWTLQPKHEWDVAAGAALVAAAGGEVWLPHGGALGWNRRRPRFPSFAACRADQRVRIAASLGR